MTTLYPHEVVVKWFEKTSAVVITFFGVIIGVSIFILYLAFDAAPTVLTDERLMQTNLQYQPSCFSPTLLVVGPLMVVVGIFLVRDPQ